jgi:glycosyltransferase involved in cell wall biosynthesis
VRKGGDLVLEAFRRLHEEDGGLRLVIAGPAEDPAPGMEGVEYVGDVGNEALGRLMASSDVFVMPSRFEAYGLVFPEAMAAGLPCVGRDRFVNWLSLFDTDLLLLPKALA